MSKPKTISSHLNIGHPKQEASLPTVHFQGLLLLVSGRAFFVFTKISQKKSRQQRRGQSVMLLPFFHLAHLLKHLLDPFPIIEADELSQGGHAPKIIASITVIRRVRRLGPCKGEGSFFNVKRGATVAH